MPDQLEDQILVVKRFHMPVGQNSQDAPASLKDYEVATLSNALVSSRGRRQTRPGNTLIADTPTSLAVVGLAPFYPEGGTKQLLMVSGTNWYKYTSGAGSWSSILSGLTTGLRSRMVVGSGYSLLLNGTDNVESYDGTTVADEGNVNASCPKGTMGIFHQNMFIITGHLTTKSYFWWSGVGNRTFDRSTNVHKVGDKDNGIIKAILSLSLTTNHGFLIFKSNGIYFIDSSSGTVANWSKILIDDSRGLAATDTAVIIGNSGNGGGDVFYLSNDGASGGVNKFRVRSLLRTINDKLLGSGVLSDKIQPSLDAINASLIDKCCAVYFDNKYFLAFPSGSATYNNTVAVLDLNTSVPEEGFWDWSVWSGMNVAAWAVFEDSNGVRNLYYGEASATTKVYKALTGTSDNGTAISFDEVSRAEDFGQPENDKSFQFVEVAFETTDNTLVTVKASVDGGSMITLGTVNVQDASPSLPVNLPFNLASGGKVRKKFQMEDLGKGREAQVEVTHSELDKTVKYLGYCMAAFIENVELGDDTV